MIGEKVACYHCGEKCDEGDFAFDGKSFCCGGCRSVYQVLQESQLCTYYAISDKPGRTVDSLRSSGRFAWLDDPAVADRLLEFRQEGRCHITLRVPEMHCSSCIWLLEHLHRLDAGVMSSKVNFPARTVHIVFDETETSLRKVVEWMSRIGYEPSLSMDREEPDGKGGKTRASLYRIGVAGFCFGNIMMLSLPDYFGAGLSLNPGLHRLFMALNVALSLPVVFFSASEFFVSAWKGLRGRFLNIDLPIALAIGVTFLRSLWDWWTGAGAGFFDSMAGIVFFMLVGRHFQKKTWHHLSFDRDFRSYFPVAVTTVVDSATQSKAVADIVPGDIIRVHLQELVPADSLLLSPAATIDYSFVTGESAPVEHVCGQRVYAGGRVRGSAVDLEVTKATDQSYLTRLWNNPVFGRSEATDQTRHVEAVNRWFTAVTLVLAFGGLFFWLPSDPTRAMNAFTAVLIIACPCALLMAATFTYGNLLRILGLNGFYLRSAQVIERLSEISAMVFDKTGTLTQSQNSECQWKGGTLSATEEQVIAAVARESLHPYSRLVAKSVATSKRIHVDDVHEEVGLGVQGTVRGARVRIGSRSWVGACAGADAPNAAVWVRIGDAILGYFEIRQPMREGLGGLFGRLGERLSLWLLSGDSDRDRPHYGQLYGTWRGMFFGRTPQQKLDFVQNLQQGGAKVAMVGDGLNDAGALAASHVGIAVTDDLNRFNPACDAILDGQRLTQLDQFISFATRGRGIVNAAFAVSLIYNVIGLTYALRGELSPLIAAILMPLMSISIVGLSTLSGNVIARSLGLRTNADAPEDAP